MLSWGGGKPGAVCSKSPGKYIEIDQPLGSTQTCILVVCRTVTINQSILLFQETITKCTFFVMLGGGQAPVRLHPRKKQFLKPGTGCGKRHCNTPIAGQR